MPRLRELAHISTGYTLRGPLPANPEASIHALQAGDLSNEGIVDFEALHRADLDDLPDRFILQPGDVAFRCRGQFRAVHFAGGPRVAVMAPILIIKVREPALDPAFLALALNTGPVRSRLRTEARGSSIQFLGKAEIEDIDIPVPPAPRQRAAVAYAAMADQERQLHARLSVLRRRALDGFFEHIDGANSPREE